MSWESYFVEGEAYSNCAACGAKIPYGRSFFSDKGAVFCSEECRAQGAPKPEKKSAKSK